MALMLAICALPCMANTTCATVTSTADDGSLGTLRYAIAQANAGTCDTIAFNLNSYPATITLAQGQLEISNTTNPITIGGPGPANLAMSGNNATRVFQIDSGVTVSISGVTIENGNSAGGFGGGILNSGTATVTNSTFSGNIANLGGGIYNGGTATVTNSTFAGNSAGGGGGIFTADGPVTITNSTFSGNSARFGGGGIWGGGTTTVTNSTFAGNSAGGGGGGGISAPGGPVTITNSTFSRNSAGNGGGISVGGTATVTNSTFFGNQGGNIFNNGGQPGGAVTVKNTLLANGSSGGNCVNIPFGTFVSDGYNLSDDNSCTPFFTQVGDLNNIPAGLDPSGLQDNGGPTQTIALLPSSPGFNVIPLSPTNYCTAVDGTTPIATDQRGISRPQVSGCDIGAFEYSSDNDSAFARSNSANTFNGNQTVNGTVAATALSGNGSGLLNLNPANLSSGTAGINITGNAATANFAASAGSANTAAVATNASALGGAAAGSYARLDIGNAFTGNQMMTGNVNVSGNAATTGSVAIGGGTAIAEHLSMTFNPTFPALKPGACTIASFPFPGVSDGDSTAVGVPSTRMTGGGNLSYTAWVSAVDTITIQACNINANTPQKTAGSGVIRADVWKH